MYMLDTDILTLHIEGQARVVERVALRARDDTVAISIITRIEALLGRFSFVLKASNKEEWLRAQVLLIRWEAELAKYPVILINEAAALEFDRLRVMKSLRKIGRADILIACIALAHKATLVTRNTKDFKLVPGLKIENWAE